ncbi:ABC transporter transmembrane domain-containing protein [Oleiagrimonas soli]|uniref:ATP-binding cassette subfamily B protein n=1 Tax=Oleiagrimonas soli TaxID=1543381 RepID=A0A841KGY0_9GAMM|nr:ABC transporter ATP-binding protein [Oleiagrimonas soli]MBB6184422.1 ATP-binding cassette subfamily B protein [Oleiagrimonas soli]
MTCCAALVSGVEGVMHPLLMKAIFDEAASRADFGHFAYLVLGYLILGLSLNGAIYLLALWQLRLDNRIVKQVSDNLLRTFYAKDYREVLRKGGGHYVARIRSDVKDGVVPALQQVRTITAQIFSFVALISVLIFISWKALLILSAIIPIATFVSMIVGKKIRGLTNTERDREAELMDALTRSVGAFKMVCSFSLIPKTVGTFSRRMDDVLDSGYKRFRVVRLLQGASDLTMVISDVCSIFVGALFVFRKQMSFGSFIAFMNAFWRSATTLINIFKQWADLHSYGTTLSRVVGFIDEPTAAPYHRTGNTVSASGIEYSYNAEQIIADFSMRLEPGHSALIAGDNGSGKTTLANILSGYLSPSRGELELPARISSVTLPVLFPPIKVRDLGADRDLLTLFGIDDPDILDAYPDQLSAGQQQKVSLALALSRDADLYVLDEPLANLDVASRTVAMQEIQRRTRDRMLVIIMHGFEEYRSLFDQVHTLGAAASRTEPQGATALC